VIASLIGAYKLLLIGRIHYIMIELYVLTL
jgi:hypothetical protein